MPLQPSMSGVHINAPLQNMAVADIQNSRNFMHDRLIPSVPVMNRTDSYFTFTKDDLMRDEMLARRPGTEAAMSGFDVSSTNYTCVRYDIGKLIPDDLRRNASSPLDLDRASTLWALQKARIRKERLFVTKFFTTGIWTGSDVTPGTLWDVSTSDPFADIDTGRVYILKNGGEMPNRLGVGFDVHQALKKHPLVMERVKYVAGTSHNLADSPALETERILAAVFEVDDYVVSKAVYSTTEENASTETMGLACGETDALLCYAPPAPSLMTSSAGYIFNEQTFGGNAEGVRVKKYRDEKLESDVIEVAFSCDFKTIDVKKGYFFSAAVS